MLPGEHSGNPFRKEEAPPMKELILEDPDTVTGSDGTTYGARVYGAAREDGTWTGWLEFRPLDGGPALRTAEETSQPDRPALEYWARRLTRVYVEGALQ